MTSMTSHVSGMTYARFFPSDWRTGCLILNLEEEGLYIRFCAYMYDTGSAPPDNDAITSRLLNVQVQKYKKVMASLIAKGKIIRAQGLLINERVQAELDRYRSEHVARIEAAKKREAERKARMQLAIADAMKARAAAEAPLGQPPHQPPDQPRGGSLGGTHDQPHGVPGGVTPPNPLKSLNAGSTAVAQGDHGSGTNLEARSQKLEKKERDTQPASSMTPREEGLAGLNGSADPMIADIVGWMTGGDRQSAKNWLSTFLGQYAQEVVRESYFELKTQLADGKIISRPLQVWSKIAARLKATPRQKAAQEAPKESTRESILRFAEQAEAKLKREGHRV